MKAFDLSKIEFTKCEGSCQQYVASRYGVYRRESTLSVYSRDRGIQSLCRYCRKGRKRGVVIDTAPTGHTLLLLDAMQSYHKEVRTQGEISGAVAKLLPRLRNPEETEVVIVTLPEATPVFEAERLQKDLSRAGINNKWWIINSCLALTHTKNPFLQVKAKSELEWIEKVKQLSNSNTALVESKNTESEGTSYFRLKQWKRNKV